MAFEKKIWVKYVPFALNSLYELIVLWGGLSVCVFCLLVLVPSSTVIIHLLDERAKQQCCFCPVSISKTYPMPMADVNGGGSRGLVSARRDQILEKISTAQLQKGDASTGTGLENAIPAFSAFAALRPAPPVPAHRPRSSTTLSKPPIAPKPTHILQKRPTITVSASEDEPSSPLPNMSEQPSGSNASSPPSFVRERKNDGVSTPRASTTTRPQSTISSASTETGDMGEMSDSDFEEDRQSSGSSLQRPDNYLVGPGPHSFRRPSTLFLNGNPAIHEQIVEELRRRGILRASDHSKIAPAKTAIEKSAMMLSPSQTSSEPSPQPKPVRASSLSASSEKLENSASNRSSSTTTTSAETEVCVDGYSYIVEDKPVPDYNTGNEEEDKRLKKLHYAAKEFYTVQDSFLKYLTNMCEVYPAYVNEFGKRLGKDLLSRQGSQEHIVRELQILFQQLRGFHKALLEEFSTRLDSWSSLRPNMAEVILKYADFLKICKPFLLQKDRFVKELLRLREENKDFDNATVAFEQKILKRGVGAVVQQLDQVHQNFMRYKILMMSYNRYLEPGSEEQLKTTEAIAKLEKITQSVNDAMGLPSSEQLCRLYDRFQCHFDVFYRGRRLIREGEVLKQTRKEPQPRYLVLFSDTLWICRVMSGFTSSGLFDMGRSYMIPIEAVRTEISPHEDYERVLFIRSKVKSVILIMSSVDERRKWQADIENAREEKRRYKRRKSEALQRQKRQSMNPSAFDAPLNEESISSDQNTLEDNASVILPATTISATCNGQSATTSRRNSDSQDSSHPSTPVEEHPVTSQASYMRRKRADAVKPVWIPDESSSRCLMEGCGTVFNLINRRHHCRDCGWLICSACMGKAPLPKFQFKKEAVCSECYEKLETLYYEGKLFPTNLLVQGSDGTLRVKVPKDDRTIVVVEPQTLFVAPTNKMLKRINIEQRKLPSKVMYRNAKGGEIMRFAELSEGMVLKFYKAAYDFEPCEQYVIYGFTLKEKKADSGGTIFELRHRNQINTDRKEHLISFRVENEKSVAKWSKSLREGLGIEESP
ncbi:unnamed protein product [Cylicocyclus nassatus]|uniref:Uncharacterized protein n=1 Tax=Cylicocyclus nassatus TaxID=53992 RepID=A0AA36H0K3_CYLNA|nr:unnamed protein product [Cylicocyclus nassatus]